MNKIKKHKKRQAAKKERTEDIKLTLGLFISCIVLFGGMFAHWLMIGY